MDIPKEVRDKLAFIDSPAIMTCECCGELPTHLTLCQGMYVCHECEPVVESYDTSRGDARSPDHL